MRLDLTTTYAISDDTPNWGKWLLKQKLISVSECPSKEEFHPTNALGYLVASMDVENVDNKLIYQLFKHYQSIGCDINEASQTTGLRLIHTAIMFKNNDAVKFLINNGADGNLLITYPSKHAGKSTIQWAKYICSKNNIDCSELLEIIQ